MVCEWLNPDSEVEYPKDEIVGNTEVKNPEVPFLEDYEIEPADSFWDTFPKFGLPDRAETVIDIVTLEEKINSVKDKMTRNELKRAEKVVKDLREGASAYQKSSLPPIKTANSKSAYENGEMLTDTIATWVKKGFVAGPFECPPVPGFRANPLAAVVRNGKTRPILNMSGPKKQQLQ